MKEAVIIIHGYMASPERVWIPWLSQTLLSSRYEVFTPSMPDPETPDLKEWLSALKQQLSQLEGGQEVTLIGHSLGATTLLRWMEEALSTEEQLIKKIILVAPPIKPRNHSNSFFTPPWNWNKIERFSREAVVLWSEDDDRVLKEDIDFLLENTSLSVEIFHGYKHFKQKELPELLKFLN